MKLIPRTSLLVRGVACLIGSGAACLTARGAWEAQLSQEGAITYLTVAAPFVVAAAALIPPIAERLWDGAKMKAVFLWLTLLPVAALAFYAAMERVHSIQAKGIAERAALATAVKLTEDDLAEARASLRKAESDEADAKSLKACKAECREKWEGDTAKARERVTAATSEVTARAVKTIEEAPHKAPLWLLPLCLDLMTFGGLWVGLAPRRRKPAKATAAADASKPKRKPRAQPSVAAQARRRTMNRVANDNVVRFPGKPAA